jgi:hypothetical protein
MRAFLSLCLPKIQRWEGMRGQNATLKCHPRSGDFAYNDEYTPTIDDNLTHGKVERQQRVSTQPDTQGVMPSQAVLLSA